MCPCSSFIGGRLSFPPCLSVCLFVCIVHLSWQAVAFVYLSIYVSLCVSMCLCCPSLGGRLSVYPIMSLCVSMCLCCPSLGGRLSVYPIMSLCVSMCLCCPSLGGRLSVYLIMSLCVSMCPCCPSIGRLGRRRAVLLGLLLTLSTGLAIPFSPSLVVFVVLRFLTAVGSIGVFTCGFVLGEQCVIKGRHKRESKKP